MSRNSFITVLSFAVFFWGCQTTISSDESADNHQDTVTGISMPYNKILHPAGEQLFFGDTTTENHALDVALSPDNKTLAIEDRFSIVFVNTSDNRIVSRFVLRQFDIGNAMNTYSGISWIVENGKQMVLWGTRNQLMKAVWDGKTAKIVKTYKFIPKPGARASLPNEMAINKEGGELMAYLVLNGNDEVVKLELSSGKIIWQQAVGLAPYGITLSNGKLYVSNWSGSAVSDNSQATAGIPWGKALVDERGTVSSGSVSVLNTQTGNTVKEIKVGLHPNHIIRSQDGEFVYVANGNDDNISVISTITQAVVETIDVRLNQKENPYFGDTPNGLALSSDNKKLYVANGMDNALAVVALGRTSSSGSKAKRSRILGFIPTAAYPGGIDIYKDSILYVANIEGVGARVTIQDTTNRYFQSFIQIQGKRKSTAGAFNSHRMLSTISIIPMPNKSELEVYTETVKNTNQQSRLALLKLLPRDNVKAVAVPERIGEPSVFKHVIYIIKENRTYDQVLGDVKKGDGDASLCAFGQEVTPNAHKLVDEFVLLDNYKASGKCSAEGHLWTDASTVTDYIEKNVRAWFRSYTHVLYDAMAYPKTGFLWDNALDHGKTVRIYGETAIPKWSNGDGWKEIYEGFKAGDTFHFTNTTTIDRVRGILSPGYPGYDSHNVPDIIRAKAFIDELKAYEDMDGDFLPSLCILALPNDHTSGTSPAHPTPRAMVADNDYALGQIIEALSKSKFWKNTVVFVTEDDSQNGWDHVSAYRTVGMVISAYSKSSKVVSTDYNQTSMIRTMEQILGLPPMNIVDATANPMFDIFETKADLTPYVALRNIIPLDEMNQPLTALRGKAKDYAIASSVIAKKGIDAGDDNLFNQIIWSVVKKGEPYPSKYISKDIDMDDD